MPRDLPPEAKKCWRRFAPGLYRKGLLTKLDETAFASLCLARSVIHDLREIVARDGPTITSSRGKVSLHPAAKELVKWEKEYLAWAREFGLTPSSRAKIRVYEPDPEEDDFLKILDGGRDDD